MTLLHSVCKIIRGCRKEILSLVLLLYALTLYFIFKLLYTTLAWESPKIACKPSLETSVISMYSLEQL